MASGKLVQKLFNLQPGESQKSLILAAFYFVAGVYAVVIESMSYAVFNIRFGVKYLPYIFLIVPFLNMAVSLWVMHFMRVGRQRKVFRNIIWIIAGIHLLGFLLLANHGLMKPMYALFFIVMFVVLENLILLRTFLLQNIMDIESGKRIVPIAAGGFAIGAIITGYSIRSLQQVLSSEAIYIGAGLSLFLMAYLGDLLFRKYRIINMQPNFIGKVSLGDACQFLLKNWFYLILTLIVATLFITSNINSYLFNLFATRALHDEAKITVFMGQLMMFQFLLSLIINLFFFSRVIQKVGTLNMMKIVLLNGIIGMVLLVFGERNLFLAVLSRAILTIMVINLGDLLLDLLYQPIPGGYRERVISLIYYVFTCVGFTLGGLITVFHAQGIMNIIYIFLIPMLLLTISFIIWTQSKNGFIAVINQNNGSGKELNFTTLFGRKGLLNYIPYLSIKVKQGSSNEKRFVLDLIKQLEFPGKDPLLLEVYKNSSLEVRFKILEILLERRISKAFIVELREEIDLESLQFLLDTVFFRISGFQNNEDLKIIQPLVQKYSKTQFRYEISLIYEYLFESNVASYRTLLDELLQQNRNEDFHRMLQMMKNHPREFQLHKTYLKLLLNKISGSLELLKEAVELCAKFDKDLDLEYLKTILVKHCNYLLMEEITDFYDSELIYQVYISEGTLFSATLALYSARNAKLVTDKKYQDLYYQVFDKLEQLTIEKQKIFNSDHCAKNLLLEACQPIQNTVAAVLIDYLFLKHEIPLIQKLDQQLSVPYQKELIFETIKNSLSVKDSNLILPVLQEEISILDEHLQYNALDVGDFNSIIVKTYEYLGGEVMPEEFCQEIEELILLKEVPMFSELSFDTLYQLLKIAVHKRIKAGETIIRKGDIGDTFYVLQSGEVGVYVTDKGGYIAKIGCGGIFGELGIIDKDTRTATIKALQDTILLEFNGDDFLTMIRTNSSIAFSVIRTLSQRLREMLTA